MDIRSYVAKWVDKKTIALVIISIVLLLMVLPRIHYNLFWGDECFSIASTESFSRNIDMTTSDAASNPPLYLFLLYSFCAIIGRSPETYQLFSMIAWFMIVLISCTVINKKFGFSISLIFILLVTFLDNTIGYMTEVRSYEWGALFVLLDYLVLYEILKHHKIKYYCYFVIVSLCAAYTHYYCLLAVSFFYLILLVEIIISNNKEIKYFMIASIATVIGYIPWLFVAYNGIVFITTNFWATTVPSMYDILIWMFSSSYSAIMVILMIGCTVAVIIKGTKVRDAVVTIPYETMWIIAGMSSVFGSILVASIVSDIFRPLILMRSMYPVSIIALLLFSYSIVKCWGNNPDLKKTVSISTVILLLVIGVPCYHATMSYEKNLNDITENTLESLSDVEEGGYIFHDIMHFDYLSEHYFPGVDCNKKYIDMCDLDIDNSRPNYLFLSGAIDSGIIKGLNDKGYSYEIMMEGANICNYYFNAYRIVPL